MAITGASRLTFRQQESRGVEFRGRALALEIRGPKGLETRAKVVIPNLATILAVKGVTVKAYSPLGFELNTVLLVGRTASEIDAHCEEIDNLFPVLAQAAADRKPEIELPEMIDDPRMSFKVAKEAIEVSLQDGRARAKGINEQNPGHKVRIPTEPELLQLNELLGDKLEGANFWIWTETEHEEYPGEFVLRFLGSDGRDRARPEGDYIDYAVRLVEDRKV